MVREADECCTGESEQRTKGKAKKGKVFFFFLRRVLLQIERGKKSKRKYCVV
jgi:hypothetical protein